MSKQLIFISDVEKSLNNGIVCYKVEEEEISHFFFTRNSKLINHLTKGFSPEINHKEVYDILNHKVLELKTDLFTGGVYSVAGCFAPSEELELKDASLYLGSKSGAVVLSDKLLATHGECSLEEFDIVGEEKFHLFKVCLGIENEQLEDIYLVQEEV
jgi:hypothetical protein